MAYTVTSRRTGRWYAAIVIGLVALHLISWALTAAGYPGQLGVGALVGLDGEASLPAMFAALSLFTCGLLLAVIASHETAHQQRHLWHWRGLAMIFVFLAIDEAIAIHELIGRLLNRVVETEGVLSFAWVVPYGILALLGAIAYVPWLVALPDRSRRRFILAAVLYFAGAIGMEMIGAWMFDNDLRGSHWYTLEITIEEVLEFSGVGVFLCALIDYLRQLRASVTLEFANGENDSSD